MSTGSMRQPPMQGGGSSPSAGSQLLSPTIMSPLDPSSSRRPSSRMLLSPGMTSGSTNTSLSLFAGSDLPQPTSRRASGLSVGMGRKASSASVSGTSTPDYARRAKRLEARGLSNGPVAGAGPAGTSNATLANRDWAGVEPDEVFRLLSVQEVRKVEAKLRAEAKNKQSELRSMVGARYRDLLTSASQITQLRSSSLKLSGSLRQVAASCSMADTAVTAEGSVDGDADDAVSMLPVAAHMKLLLDAPEALYTHLSREDYLSAAYLWLVARVVKQGLSSMDEGVKAPYLPLLQKQWEALLPFREQIVQRATASLQTNTQADTRSTSETLLAIILLDNVSLAETLALLLSQRTRALEEILAHTQASSDASTSSPATKTRRRTLSRSKPVQERENIAAVLSSSVRCMLETVACARAVFSKDASGPSTLEEMIRLIQLGGPLPSTSQPPPPVRRMSSSHQRRASRLASISLPIPPSDPSGAPITTPQVVQCLPSSQILLRYLPNSITGFTPFIAPSAAPDLDAALEEWQTASIELLRRATPTWLSDIHTVSTVWQVRGLLGNVLADDGFSRLISSALEDEWGRRIKHVWSEKLGGLLVLAENEVLAAAEELKSGALEDDLVPEQIAFSDLAFPTMPSSSLAAPHTSFSSFLQNIKRRTAKRTPKLDRVLVAIEKAAAEIRADSHGLPQGMYAEYTESARHMLQDLAKSLERLLADVAKPGGQDGETLAEQPVAAEMFVGRVALYLGSTSSFLSDIKGGTELVSDTFVQDMVRVHAQSTTRWREQAIAGALQKLNPLFDGHLDPSDVRASWQGEAPYAASQEIIVALDLLVKATWSLGVPDGASVDSTQRLVEAFVTQARDLEGWNALEQEAAVQAAVDLAFLNLLKGETASDPLAEKLLNKAGSSCPKGFKADMPAILHDTLRKHQVLLRPLLAHLDPAKLGLAPTAPTADQRMANLMRFGAPAARGIGIDFRSPLAVAKPGKRFALISIPS